MGVARRIAELYKVKMNAALDRATDPREMLDYTYLQLQDLLAEVRRSTAELAAGRTRAQAQVAGLQRTADRLEQQAEQAVAGGRQDLARQALARRTAVLTQAADLSEQQAMLRGEEERLSAAQRRLQDKIEAFRLRKETVKAAYTAAQANASIAEAFAGISGDVGDADVAARRAEDRAADLDARAKALQDLATPGSVGGFTAVAGDDLQAQLDEISTRAAVDEELARIKDRLASQAQQPDADSAEGGAAAPATTPPQDGGAPPG